jgi:hypothetical protein
VPEGLQSALTVLLDQALDLLLSAALLAHCLLAQLSIHLALTGGGCGVSGTGAWGDR